MSLNFHSTEWIGMHLQKEVYTPAVGTLAGIIEPALISEGRSLGGWWWIAPEVISAIRIPRSCGTVRQDRGNLNRRPA